MSFFDAFSRLLQGKVPYEPEPDDTLEESSSIEDPYKDKESSQQEPSKPTSPDDTIVKGNEHTFPRITIKKTIPRMDSTRQKVYCWIRNDFHGEIELDKIVILDKKREIDTYLRPGQEKEVLIYDGPKFDHEPHNEEAHIDYRTKHKGDYFRIEYHVEYNRNADGTYNIEDLHFHHLRDIYE